MFRCICSENCHILTILADFGILHYDGIFHRQSLDFSRYRKNTSIVVYFPFVPKCQFEESSDRTEPKFLRIKMYPNKVICEIWEEFCGVTASGKIIEVSK